MAAPRVTVLMPVYNGERFLRAAIESVLTQSFADFEFLIIDDGSTDRSAEVLSEFSDARIRVLRNRENLKLAVEQIIGVQEQQELPRGVLDAQVARAGNSPIRLFEVPNAR